MILQDLKILALYLNLEISMLLSYIFFLFISQ